MSEKYVLKRPEDDQRRYAHFDQPDELPKEYITMSVGDDFVSLVQSEKRVGTTQNGKTWVRFDDQLVTIFKLGRYADGRPRVNVYRKTRTRPSYRDRMNGTVPKGMRLENITSRLAGVSLFSQYDTVAAGEFIKIYEREFGPSGQFPTAVGIRRLAYPMLRDNEHWQYARPLGSALRQTNVRSFIEASFGKTRYRKDLVKAIAHTNSTHAIAVGHAFRGLMPLDWIIDALFETKPYRQYEEFGDISNMRRIARLTDEKSGRRLLRQMLNEDIPRTWVRDSLRSIDQILEYGDVPELGRVQNWREAHDSLMVQARQVVKKNQRIPQDHKIIKAIEGETFFIEGQHGTYHFESAKDTDTLEIWGSKMANCIGTYNHSAMSGSSLLFGLFRDGELIGNMEVAPDGRVRQLVGKYNSSMQNYNWIRNWVDERTEPERDGRPRLRNLVANPALNLGALVDF